jgi:transposase
MANPSKILVDIPKDKGVHIKSAGTKSEKYVYKYTSYFRNKDGAPRNKSKLIGKIDAESGRMIPNSNYYEMFKVTPEIPDLSVWGYGYTYLVQKSCKDMGLLACLQEAFGDQTDEIVAVAAFMIREGNAMDGIDDFQERNLIPGLHKSLTSQSCSRLFESINPQKFHSFFKQWVNMALRDDTVCYDVTSVSSYSKAITDVEYGYNRDHEDLPQFNIGMFCCETSKLPIYYNRYNGSLTDKTNLSYVLANAQSVGIKNVKFILDGGFMSEDCFISLNNCSNTFTIGVPAHLDISKAMIKANVNDINNYNNKLDKQEIFCVQQSTSIHGISGKLMLFFDPKNHTRLCEELSDRIDQLSEELSDLKRCPVSKLKRYAKYFIITKHNEDSGFDFIVDKTAVNQLRQNKGFFLLFSNDMAAKPEDSLYFYRAKDSDEKLFDQIKVDMEGGRIRTHNERTTDGKVFVTFIALAIRAYMLSKLNKYIASNSSSLKKVLNKLENIIVVYSNGRCRFTKALTKQQKEILESFTAAADIATTLDSCIR